MHAKWNCWHHVKSDWCFLALLMTWFAVIASFRWEFRTRQNLRNPCTKVIRAGNYPWCVFTVAHLQQELVLAHKMQDNKLTDIQRQAEDTAASQQAAFDQKVGNRWLLEGVCSRFAVFRLKLHNFHAVFCFYVIFRLQNSVEYTCSYFTGPHLLSPLFTVPDKTTSK